MIIAVYLVLLALLVLASRFVTVKVWRLWMLNLTAVVAIPVGIWQPLSMPAFLVAVGYWMGPSLWVELAKDAAAAIKERSKMTRIRLTADVVVLVPPDATSMEVEHKIGSVKYTVYKDDTILEIKTKKSEVASPGHKETYTWKS